MRNVCRAWVAVVDEGDACQIVKNEACVPILDYAAALSTFRQGPATGKLGLDDATESRFVAFVSMLSYWRRVRSLSLPLLSRYDLSAYIQLIVMRGCDDLLPIRGKLKYWKWVSAFRSDFYAAMYSD